MRYFIILLSLIYFLFSVSFVQAASLTVIPAVIDEKAKARDILKESITLTNNTSRKLNIYTFVNNISAQEGKQVALDSTKDDLSSSLAQWIWFPMGVIELLPGDTQTIDFSIRVNLRAQPGNYHAVISFGQGSTRAQAEKRIHELPSVAVNVEVLEDVKERLQLKKFISDKAFFTSSPASFSYEVENIGNKSLVPSGEIRIYNRGGEEVASFDANVDGSRLEPDTTTALASIGAISGFGRYRAVLDIEYGLKQRGTLQDTIFFWIIPWQLMAAAAGSMVLPVFVFVGFIYHRGRKNTKYPYEHEVSQSHAVDLRDMQ